MANAIIAARPTHPLAGGVSPEKFRYFLRGASDNGKKSPGGLVRLSPALFPIPERSQRNMIARREFFLGQPQGAAEGLHPRHGPELRLPCGRQRRVIGITRGRGLDVGLTHRRDRGNVQNLFLAVRLALHKLAITLHSRGSSCLSHASLPCGPLGV
jgi:hypothetical protein